MSSVTFDWKHQARDVKLAGSFNQWKEQPMKKNGQRWVAEVKLTPDVYQYKFIVDGKWIFDSEKPLTDDGRGNTNNYLEVREPTVQNASTRSVEHVLDLVSKTLKVDRTFIFTNGWTGGRYNLHIPTIGKTAEEKGEVMVVNDVEKVSGDKEEISKLGIRAFVLVPFNTHFGGHLGVAANKKRDWNGWELTILQAAGKVVADILSELPAQEKVKQFEQLVDASALFSNLAPLSQKEGKYLPTIEGVATANPGPKVPQSECRDWIKNISSLRDMLHRVDALYENTKINTRHLANPDFSKPFDPTKFEFYPHSSDLLPLPPIQDRLRKFDEYAGPVVVKAAEDAMKNAGVTTDQIGKLIFVTSTGFSGPGLDCHLIKTLGLSAYCERALVGFMGCAAAMNGFRVACDFAVAHPDKKALMVAVEVSSVHGAFADNMNDMIIHALFADGCGAVVIGAKHEGEIVPKPFGRQYEMEIITAKSWLVPGTEDGITLAIQNEGITCTLSRQLPQYIFACAKKYADMTLEPLGFFQEDVDHWMIHPGGTRIIQSAAASLGLDENQTAQSWAVLGEFGNMLSPSIIFVLSRIRKELELSKRNPRENKKGFELAFAFSFAPGVGVEGCLIKIS